MGIEGGEGLKEGEMDAGGELAAKCCGNGGRKEEKVKPD